MIKKLKKPGINILVAEIQNISKYGIWIFVNDQEYFLSFDQYPWFQNATVDQIYDFEFSHYTHLYWPTLDIDIDLKSIQKPGAYPLKYK